MPRKPVDNERKACDAVIRALEALSGVARSNGHSPEDQKLNPPVEYAFDLAQQRYVLEHTVVEAFDGQINTDVDFKNFVTPIESDLDGALPKPGFFQATFEIHPTKGMKPKAIAEAQKKIIVWIKATAAELHNEFPILEPKEQNIRGRLNFRQTTLDGVRIRLQREVGWFVVDEAQGRILTSRFAPKDYEKLRIARVKGAVDRKLPKLHQSKGANARSILVLENRDLALSSHIGIGDAVEQVLAGRSDVPDEVWLVDAVIPGSWKVICLVRDGVVFPDDQSEKRLHEFNPANLQQI